MVVFCLGSHGDREETTTGGKTSHGVFSFILSDTMRVEAEDGGNPQIQTVGHTISLLEKRG